MAAQDKVIGALHQGSRHRRVKCPFVATLHYAFQSRSKLHLVTDLVAPGGPLFATLARSSGPDSPALQEARGRFYAAEVVLGLEHLHVNGLLHGNLKPNNVLLDSRTGHIVLTDFGCYAATGGGSSAKHIDCDVSRPPKLDHEARCYLAPEQRGNKQQQVTEAADWWGLGVLLAQLLGGQLPYDTAQLAALRKGHQQLPRLAGHLSSAATSLVHSLLRLVAHDRLGAGAGSSGAQAVRSHPFWQPIDWGRVLARQVEPPPVCGGDFASWENQQFQNSLSKHVLEPRLRHDRRASLGSSSFASSNAPTSSSRHDVAAVSVDRAGNFSRRQDDIVMHSVSGRSAPRCSDAKIDPRRVFLGGLRGLNRQQLTSVLLAEYGPLASELELKMAPDGKVPRGFGFATFVYPEHAAALCDDQILWVGHHRVEAKPCLPPAHVGTNSMTLNPRRLSNHSAHVTDRIDRHDGETNSLRGIDDNYNGSHSSYGGHRSHSYSSDGDDHGYIVQSRYY
eukprot:SAG31_NODE_6277_length_2092_cov_1.167587_2_plen_506_part_00